MTSETTEQHDVPELDFDGPPVVAAIASKTEVVAGPITGWTEHGPTIARLGEDGRFIELIPSSPDTMAWVGSYGPQLVDIASLYLAGHLPLDNEEKRP